MHRREFIAALSASPLAFSCGLQPEAQTSGLKLSITCDMFRGNQRGLPVDTLDGEDPRPDPDISYTPDEGLALARSHGYEGFEMFDWRNGRSGPPMRPQSGSTHWKPSASPPTRASGLRAAA